MIDTYSGNKLTPKEATIFTGNNLVIVCRNLVGMGLMLAETLERTGVRTGVRHEYGMGLPKTELLPKTEHGLHNGCTRVQQGLHRR